MTSPGVRKRAAASQKLIDVHESHECSSNSSTQQLSENGFCDESHHFHSEQDQPSGLEGDRGNVLLLTGLYILQGIPLGLAGSIPMILQNRKVSYRQQAVFSFVSWPFSLKLLWAPIVDSFYSNRMGRRKSWLVPIQYLLGFFMFFLSNIIDGLLGEDGTVPNIVPLTAVFFVLNFLAATQDIAVDGWALTMLSRRNVGYASTCNSLGQTAGYFMGNVVFLALESPEFCNNYLRSVPGKTGILTLSSFLYFWGWVFVISTTLVWILKTETSVCSKHENGGDVEMGIAQSYLALWKIVTKPQVLLFSAILLTAKIGFAATDTVTGLKLIEAKVPKDKLASLAVPMIPIQMILPLIISKYTAGPRPMDIYLKVIPYRLFFGLIFAGIVAWTPSMHLGRGEFPAVYYLTLLLFYAGHQVTLYSMYVALMAFNARISDKDVGGTYMTLLNTLTNMGGVWPTTLVLNFVDILTVKTCRTLDTCTTTLDGYYIITFLCIIFGFVWLSFCRSRIQNLQRINLEAWKIS